MNRLGNQRKLYLLAAALLALTILLCLSWGLWKPSGQEADLVPQATGEAAPQSTQEPVSQATTEPESTGQASAGMRETVVYYQDNNGYLVPVMREVPAEEGIAKATLSLMVQSPYNDMEAARLGLKTILPEGTTIDLDINSEGRARIDLGSQINQLADAEAESNMVSAIVQTLTEFPTVKTVEFLVDGKQVNQLKYGTKIDGAFERGMLNLESAVPTMATPSEYKTVELYFPGETGSLLVPVTRMVYGNDDINTAMLELCKGPSADSPLESTLPAGCGLIGVNMDGTTAVVNFTKEFMNLAEQSDGGRQALKALVLTATQFPGVEKVEIQVEGEPYDASAATMSVPTFVNEADAITDQFLQTQTAQIFDME